MTELDDGSSEQPAIIYKGKKPYKMIGPYLMGDVIGEGAQGKVREAVHSESLRRVAIKIVNMRTVRRTRHGEESLRDEIAIHRKLKHPNIVELIEEFLLPEKDKWYIVLEFIAGVTLQDLCDAHPGRILPDSLPQYMMRQLLRALDYCHGRGVVHRDIKPQNMLVDAYGNLKLCDFGVAVQLSAYGSDVCSKTRGSPAFQPPEVAAGSEAFSGFKVDVWAAGVSLYLLVTGKVPFEGSSLIQLFEKIAIGEYPIPASISEQPQLLSLLSGLMEVDCEKRLTVSEALTHPWLAEGSDSLRGEVWGDAERDLLLSIGGRGGRTSAVLRSIARKYGEEIDDSPTAGVDGQLAVSMAQSARLCDRRLGQMAALDAGSAGEESIDGFASGSGDVTASATDNQPMHSDADNRQSEHRSNVSFENLGGRVSGRFSLSAPSPTTGSAAEGATAFAAPGVCAPCSLSALFSPPSSQPSSQPSVLGLCNSSSMRQQPFHPEACPPVAANAPLAREKHDGPGTLALPPGPLARDAGLGSRSAELHGAHRETGTMEQRGANSSSDDKECIIC